MAARQWSVSDFLRSYGPIFARKVGFIALGWIPVFFISYPFRGNGIPMLFAPLLGAFVGLISGWYIATDSVDDSGIHGLPLWSMLVGGAACPIWITDWILRLFMPRWPFDFGAWMLLAFASLMILASAVWHASSQE